ncbi:MAG TPA: acetyl-CoA carboxylase biotin carboxylase subunit [Ktedonobacteraceae bacterium]|jgi:3-methylcrotonyl-CoA carboxylase alpha subunit|nr:acetyl-CoA carboxylase biotin carboxylase subunit [Ktedonobacteraceae bacterium]
MFKKILIANRGEIAIRVMATCREMGIATVVVYSEADRQARHVREADEAYYIGTAPATESYLRIPNILAAAKQSGAEAIHPGYGFLSENAAFAEACEEAGIVFIGPPASAMRLMGSKIAAKKLAESVGAPTIPGYNGDSQEDETLLEQARRIGFPILIKASAGGGGKGMRAVYQPDEFLDQLAGARREALNAFGDSTVLLERLIQQPRHVEIQVLGDTYGNLIHLGERECSIQRRHQKILEESPSVALTPALRAEMGTAAVRIAKAAGYVNAGTMEFILDTDGRFYFLEMNTRLQVEHPVTELVTGFDLVRHQILIAAGEPLGISQEQIYPRGHAIEVRLYAEDPENNFLPSTGTVTTFVPPHGPGIRLDSGIESGDEITQYYDPMIAKLIVSGENRTAAIKRLQAALEQQVILGVKTNASLLHDIAIHPAFQEGQTYTSFLETHHMLQEVEQESENIDSYALAAAAFYDLAGMSSLNNSGNGHLSRITSNDPWKYLGPWRMTGEARNLTYDYRDTPYRLALFPPLNDEGSWTIEVNDEPALHMTYTTGNDGLILLKEGAKRIRAYVAHNGTETLVSISGRVYRLARRQPPDADIISHGGSAAHSQKALTAPMAGTIVKVQVHDGEHVKNRQVLVILSAMKMEHSIVAPYEGKVRRVNCHEGEVVKGGAVVVEME